MITHSAASKETKRFIWQLGLVSFFTDLSSDMIIPTLAFFVANVLGAGYAVFGLMEAISESASSLLKIPSGMLSDAKQRRLPIVQLGYGLSLLGKVMLPLSFVWQSAVGARVLDRVGKGMRTSPRDAMLAESVDESHRGWAFGLHRSMDSAGAVLAPLIAYLFLSWRPNHYVELYWIAVIPAAISMLILFLIKEPLRKPTQSKKTALLKSALPDGFKRYLVVMGLFSLCNSSDLFLLIRLEQIGWSPTTILLAYSGFNLVAAIMGARLGTLSDKIGRKKALIIGFVVYIVIYAGFACAELLSAWLVLLMLVGYGFYYGLTDGVSRAYAGDLSGAGAKGTGLGIYHAVVGIGVFISSLAAGLLLDAGLNWAPYALGSIGATWVVVGLIIMRIPETTNKTQG